MKLHVNGVQHDLNPTLDPANLEAVIEALAQNPRLVVVEHNGVIVPRSQWQVTPVDDGDNLEIVTIVGGGS